MTSSLKIGEVAKLSGVGIDTVRYYERRGVLPRIPRRSSGYRAFTNATVERIRSAKALQALGFTLDEIVELLRSVDSGSATCGSERRRFENVLGRVDERLAELRSIRRSLLGTLRRCDSGECSLLEKAPRSREQQPKRGAS
jgi:DNA-binding transcriptional MerR regulator